MSEEMQHCQAVAHAYLSGPDFNVGGKLALLIQRERAAARQGSKLARPRGHRQECLCPDCHPDRESLVTPDDVVELQQRLDSAEFVRDGLELANGALQRSLDAMRAERNALQAELDALRSSEAR